MPDRLNKTGFGKRSPCGTPWMSSSVVRNPQRVTVAPVLAALIRNIAQALLGPKLAL